MLDLEDVAQWFGDAVIDGVVGRAIRRRRRRRVDAAVAAGRAATFPGWVLGSRPYCRPAGGLLVLTANGVHHVVDRGMPITRRDLPVERLTLIGRRTATWDDSPQVPALWMTLECYDGAERVLVVTHEDQIAHVERAITRG